MSLARLSSISLSRCDIAPSADTRRGRHEARSRPSRSAPSYAPPMPAVFTGPSVAETPGFSRSGRRRISFGCVLMSKDDPCRTAYVVAGGTQPQQPTEVVDVFQEVPPVGARIADPLAVLVSELDSHAAHHEAVIRRLGLCKECVIASALFWGQRGGRDRKSTRLN